MEQLVDELENMRVPDRDVEDEPGSEDESISRLVGTVSRSATTHMLLTRLVRNSEATNQHLQSLTRTSAAQGDMMGRMVAAMSRMEQQMHDLTEAMQSLSSSLTLSRWPAEQAPSVGGGSATPGSRTGPRIVGAFFVELVAMVRNYMRSVGQEVTYTSDTDENAVAAIVSVISSSVGIAVRSGEPWCAALEQLVTAMAGASYDASCKNIEHFFAGAHGGRARGILDSMHRSLVKCKATLTPEFGDIVAALESPYSEGEAPKLKAVPKARQHTAHELAVSKLKQNDKKAVAKSLLSGLSLTQALAAVSEQPVAKQAKVKR